MEMETEGTGKRKGKSQCTHGDGENAKESRERRVSGQEKFILEDGVWQPCPVTGRVRDAGRT